MADDHCPSEPFVATDDCGETSAPAITLTTRKDHSLNALRLRRLCEERRAELEKWEQNRYLRWQVSPSSSLPGPCISMESSRKSSGTFWLDVAALRRIRGDNRERHDNQGMTTKSCVCQNSSNSDNDNSKRAGDDHVENLIRLEEGMEFMGKRFRELVLQREQHLKTACKDLQDQTKPSSSLHDLDRRRLHREFSALSTRESFSSSISLYRSVSSSPSVYTPPREPTKLSVLLHPLSFIGDSTPQLQPSAFTSEIRPKNLDSTFLLELGRLMEGHNQESLDSTNSSISSLGSDPPCVDGVLSKRWRGFGPHFRLSWLLLIMPLLLIIFASDDPESDKISFDDERVLLHAHDNLQRGHFPRHLVSTSRNISKYRSERQEAAVVTSWNQAQLQERNTTFPFCRMIQDVGESTGYHDLATKLQLTDLERNLSERSDHSMWDDANVSYPMYSQTSDAIISGQSVYLQSIDSSILHTNKASPSPPINVLKNIDLDSNLHAVNTPPSHESNLLASAMQSTRENVIVEDAKDTDLGFTPYLVQPRFWGRPATKVMEWQSSTATDIFEHFNGEIAILRLCVATDAEASSDPLHAIAESHDDGLQIHDELSPLGMLRSRLVKGMKSLMRNIRDELDATTIMGMVA